MPYNLYEFISLGNQTVGVLRFFVDCLTEAGHHSPTGSRRKRLFSHLRCYRKRTPFFITKLVCFIRSYYISTLILLGGTFCGNYSQNKHSTILVWEHHVLPLPLLFIALYQSVQTRTYFLNNPHTNIIESAVTQITKRLPVIVKDPECETWTEHMKRFAADYLFANRLEKNSPKLKPLGKL